MNLILSENRILDGKVGLVDVVAILMDDCLSNLANLVWGGGGTP